MKFKPPIRLVKTLDLALHILLQKNSNDQVQMNNSREDNYSTPYTQDPDIKFICLGTLSSKNNDSFVSVYPNNYIDDFIERLVEEKETVLPKRNPVISASMLLQLGYESKCLSVMEFFGLDWDLYKWPDFIQNFKNLVHDNTQFYR